MTAYGLLPKTPDERDYEAPASIPPWDGVTHVDLVAGFPEPPYDQGQLGSCVSNGTAAAVDYARAKAGLPALKRPSRLFIYYNGRKRAGYPLDQDTGLQIRDGFTVIAKDGAPPESDWPYDVTRFADPPPAVAYADGGHDVAVAYGSVPASRIDDVIAAGYPVVFGFTVYESFESASTARTGVMPVPNKATERTLGGHCVVFVSTPVDGSTIPGAVPGRKYRKARNSWGHDGSWGIPAEPGYFWFPVDEVLDGDSSDFWMVTAMGDPNTPQPPSPPSPPGPTPATADADLAKAAHTWLGHRHHGVANDALAVALHAWLSVKGL